MQLQSHLSASQPTQNCNLPSNSQQLPHFTTDNLSESLIPRLKPIVDLLNAETVDVRLLRGLLGRGISEEAVEISAGVPAAGAQPLEGAGSCAGTHLPPGSPPVPQPREVRPHTPPHQPQRPPLARARAGLRAVGADREGHLPHAGRTRLLLGARPAHPRPLLHQHPPREVPPHPGGAGVLERSHLPLRLHDAHPVHLRAAAPAGGVRAGHERDPGADLLPGERHAAGGGAGGRLLLHVQQRDERHPGTAHAGLRQAGERRAPAHALHQHAPAGAGTQGLAPPGRPQDRPLLLLLPLDHAPLLAGVPDVRDPPHLGGHLRPRRPHQLHQLLRPRPPPRQQTTHTPRRLRTDPRRPQGHQRTRGDRKRDRGGRPAVQGLRTEGHGGTGGEEQEETAAGSGGRQRQPHRQLLPQIVLICTLELIVITAAAPTTAPPTIPSPPAVPKPPTTSSPPPTVHRHPSAAAIQALSPSWPTISPSSAFASPIPTSTAAPCISAVAVLPLDSSHLLFLPGSGQVLPATASLFHEELVVPCRYFIYYRAGSAIWPLALFSAQSLTTREDLLCAVTRWVADCAGASCCCSCATVAPTAPRFGHIRSAIVPTGNAVSLRWIQPTWAWLPAGAATTARESPNRLGLREDRGAGSSRGGYSGWGVWRRGGGGRGGGVRGRGGAGAAWGGGGR